MILSRLIAIGFLGSIFAMFRFAKYCHLLNALGLEQEEAERYQARAAGHGGAFHHRRRHLSVKFPGKRT